jgi:hypothetical protein
MPDSFMRVVGGVGRRLWLVHTGAPALLPRPHSVEGRPHATLGTIPRLVLACVARACERRPPAPRQRRSSLSRHGGIWRVPLTSCWRTRSVKATSLGVGRAPPPCTKASRLALAAHHATGTLPSLVSALAAEAPRGQGDVVVADGACRVVGMQDGGGHGRPHVVGPVVAELVQDLCPPLAAPHGPREHVRLRRAPTRPLRMLPWSTGASCTPRGGWGPQS